MKNIIVDGRTLGNNKSSISIYLLNLIDSISRVNKFKIYLVINKENTKKNLNKLSKDINIRFIYSNIKNPIIWDNIIMPYNAIKTKSKIIFYPKGSTCYFKIPSKIIITTIHGMIYKIYPNAHTWWVNLYWRITGKIASIISNKIIVVSKSDKNDLATEGYKTEKMKIIPIGISKVFSEVFEEKLVNNILVEKNLGKKKYFIQIGHILNKKNQLFSLERTKKYLLEEGYKFVFIGRTNIQPKYYEKLLFFIKNNNLQTKVIFMGGIEQNDKKMPILMQNAKVGFFPSIYEGFGMPPLEMISSGIPVVTSDRGSLPEILRRENTISLDNKKRWNEIIMKLLTDDIFYKKVLNRQKKIALKYDWNNIVKDYVSLFNNAIK